jgi:hypothetical protein
LRGLAGDAEPGADLSPGVTVLPEAGHGIADAAVDGVGQLGHEGQGLDVARGDTPGTRPQDTPGERGVLRVLDDPPRPVGCQGLLDSVQGTLAFGVFGAYPRTAVALAFRALDSLCCHRC